VTPTTGKLSRLDGLTNIDEYSLNGNVPIVGSGMNPPRTYGRILTTLPNGSVEQSMILPSGEKVVSNLDVSSVLRADESQVFDPRTGLCGDYGPQTYTLPPSPQQHVMSLENQNSDASGDQSQQNITGQGLPQHQHSLYEGQSYVHPPAHVRGYEASAPPTLPHLISHPGYQERQTVSGSVPQFHHHGQQLSAVVSEPQTEWCEPSMGAPQQFHHHQGPRGKDLVSQFSGPQPTSTNCLSPSPQQESYAGTNADFSQGRQDQYPQSAYGTGQTGKS
jgi:hypothetical protein